MRPAQAGTVIRDAEIEATLKEYLQPLLTSAGMPEDSVRVIIIGDPALNAYVAGGTNIFINTGLILASEKPDMIIGVMAHELGHITGGHLIRGSQAMKQMQLEYGLVSLLSVAAAAAGAGQLGSAAMAAGGHYAQSGFLSFSRSQEQAADQAALNYLDKAQLTTQGLLDTLTLLRQKERLAPMEGGSYLRTHPLTVDRMAHVRSHNEQSPYKSKGEKDPHYIKHQRMRAKLAGFLNPPQETLKDYKGKTDEAADIALSVAYFRQSQLDKALTLLNEKIAKAPEDAFMHELKGQILFESGKVPEAIAAYDKANDLLPDNALIAQAYAHALLTRGDKEDLERTEMLLLQVTRADPDNLAAWRDLAAVYSQTDRQGKFHLARAEESMARAQFKDALAHGREAQKLLPEGTPARLRAEDLLADAEKKAKKDKD